MNNFTKGEWVVDEKVERLHNHIECTVSAPYALVCKCVGTTNPMLDWYAGARDVKANAQLIATSGTTATKLAEKGYDAVKVLELLPQLVDILSNAYRDCEDIGGYTAYTIIKQCRGDV